MVPDSRVSSNAATPVRHPQPLDEVDEEHLDVGAGPPKRPRLRIDAFGANPRILKPAPINQFIEVSLPGAIGAGGQGLTG